MENRCVMCGEVIPEGRMVCHSCDGVYNNPGDCRKCLHFNWCTDKGNHNYSGCSMYFVDICEYFKAVRCVGCKHYNHSKGKCKLSGMKMDKTDFCSKGVKAKKEV